MIFSRSAVTNVALFGRLGFCRVAKGPPQGLLGTVFMDLLRVISMKRCVKVENVKIAALV